jgi:hypothetical protein
MQSCNHPSWLTAIDRCREHGGSNAALPRTWEEGYRPQTPVADMGKNSEKAPEISRGGAVRVYLVVKLRAA